MTYDLVIKDGTLIDGSGLPRYRADVGVKNGRIVSIGRIRAGAQEMIDAEGCVVAPAFIDGHTHMDAAGVPGPARHLLQRALNGRRVACTPFREPGRRGYRFRAIGSSAVVLENSNDMRGPKGKCHLGEFCRPRRLHARRRGSGVVKSVAG